MNYYRRHIGDYIRDTAHLSGLEDGMYTRLLDLYYMRETPIPADIDQACRLTRARSEDERHAVEVVLNEFFTLQDDGWHQKRVDGEIQIAREAAEKARKNGKPGGRPRKTQKDPESIPEITQPVSTENPEITQPVIFQNPEKSSPTTNHQPPVNTPVVPLAGDANSGNLDKPKRKRQLPDDFSLTDLRRQAAVRYWRERDRLDLNPNDEFEKFKSHHRGKGSRMADWDAAWQTWYSGALRFNTKQHQPTTSATFAGYAK